MASGFFQNEVIGALRAPAQIIQWRTSRPDPSGSLMHFESGVLKPSAKGTSRLLADALRGGFAAQMESGTAINFGSANANNSGFFTSTVALTFNLGELNNHPDSYFNEMVAASSVSSNFKAFNIRFWLSNDEVFDRNPSGIPTFYYLTSAEWRRNLKLRPTTVGAQVVPSSLPSSQNWFVQDNDVFVSGAYKPAEFTHFLYLVGEFPSGVDYALGTYGGLGSGAFTWRFSYDWTALDANVLTTDLKDCP